MNRILLLLGLFYFPAAIWLQATYIDPTPKGRIVVRLDTGQLERHGRAFFIRDVGELAKFADDENLAGDRRSPVLLFENGKLLGPSHVSFAEIRDKGGGRYSLWKQGLAFSTSDGTDPKDTGRPYWAVVP